MDILIKKAAVDQEFRALLLERRGEAAREIELALSRAEIALLNSVPAAAIEQIIAYTIVPDRHRRVFLGKVAGLMLAALGSQLAGCAPSLGIRQQDKYGGSRPDLPTPVISCDPADVHLDPDGKRLAFKVVAQGPVSVTLSVTGDCPFQSGNIEVSFRGENTPENDELVHGSEWVTVEKGKEQPEIRVGGAQGKTDWLVIRFVNRAVKPGKNKDDTLQLPRPPYEPGEYVVGECMVYRIAKFVKEWRA